MPAECVVCCGVRESEPHRAAVGKITPTVRAKERSAWLTAKRHHLTNESDGHGRYLLALVRRLAGATAPQSRFSPGQPQRPTAQLKRCGRRTAQ